MGALVSTPSVLAGQRGRLEQDHTTPRIGRLSASGKELLEKKREPFIAFLSHRDQVRKRQCWVRNYVFAHQHKISVVGVDFFGRLVMTGLHGVVVSC